MHYRTMRPAPDGFRHGFATVNGLRFHYVEGGADTERTIVLLAGFPESWYPNQEATPHSSHRSAVRSLA
ncbi:hypothetical protein [Novosphingobium rosa]|uniref:hypothetical protein n=1 Tax=Novosphingobium rosa TaxID=76978 RepID=UPI000A009A51|nr:hypothetical protein [Novosphingobium rosa]